jgi:hypothetical protein
MSLRHVIILASSAMMMLLLPAAPASADSIVYVKEGNVWLANADGSGQYQVTFDGSPGSPYESPSESDNGTVLAVHQPLGHRNQLFRMTQSGALLNPPIDTPAPGPAGAIEAKISPDGTLAAYWFVTPVFAPCAFCVEIASQTLITHSDRFTNYEEVGNPHTGIQPSWVNNNTLLLSNSNGTQWYYAIGTKEAEEWFENTGALTPAPEGISEIIADGEIAPSGDRMAVVYGDKANAIWVLKLGGPPPALPEAATDCFIEPGEKFVDPTWSSNGGQLFWSESTGVWTANIASPTDCMTGANIRLLIPGAHEPDASPAADNPGPRPGCGNPGNPAACPAPAPHAPPPPACTTCAGGGPVAAAITAALQSFLKASASALTKLKLHGLATKHRLTLTFKAPSAGTLTAQLVLRVRRTKTVLATGRHVFASAGKATLPLALTGQGRRKLRGAHTLHTTLIVGFTPAGSAHTTSLQASVTLR